MHSHHAHREHQVSHRRVAHILKDHPDGATHHAKHGGAFSQVTSKSAAVRHDSKVAGRKGPKRYARGGKVKHTTNVIVVPHRQPPPMGPQAGAPAPQPPMMGAPATPPMPMGGGMPPPMMRARGGRTIAGEAKPENLDSWSKRATKNSIASKVAYARGGRLPTAGAATGVGRIEAAELERSKHRR